MKIMKAKVLTPILALFFWMPDISFAKDVRFECSFKNLKGTYSKVEIYFDVENDWSRIIKNGNRENGDAKETQNAFITKVIDLSSVYQYTISKKNLEFNFLLKSEYIKQDSVFNGTCETHSRQSLSKSEKCELNSDLAKDVMTLRQSGFAMSKLMESNKSELMSQMVIEAYDKPRFQTEAAKKREVEDFRDKWFSMCLKSK